MLGSQDSSQLGIMQLFGNIIVSLLHLRDVQALGQASSQLRSLVHQDLSPAAWLATAQRSLPRGHPLLSISPALILQELQCLARVHACIKRGGVASQQELTIGLEGPREVHALAVSPSARLIVIKHSSHIELSRLSNLGSDGALERKVLWSIPAPAVPAPWQ